MDALLHAALNNAAWAAAMALVATVGARIWRRHPAVVHALWLMVLLKLVTPSLVHVSLSRDDGLGRDHARPVERSEASQSVVALSAPIDTGPVPADLTIDPPSRDDVDQTVEIPAEEPIATEGVHVSWRQAILALWLTGTLACWLAVGLGSARFRRLIGSARPAPPELVERLSDVAARLGLRSAPAAWLVPARVPPMLWVPLAGPPRLALPEELWGRLDAAQRDAVLAHELAHLKRRDHWVRRLEAAVLGLYWWDPVAWWARREVERSEEECCDAWVVWALPQAADAYAEALVATAAYLSGFRRSLPMGASGVGSLVSLKRRLAMIVCDSVTAPVGRTAPRVLLVLGVLTLPFLPGLAAGQPSGEPAQARAAKLTPHDGLFAADLAETPPTEAVQEPKVAPAAQPPAKSITKPTFVFQPISRELGDFVDLAEAATLSSVTGEVRSRISGRIDRVNCRPGWAIKKGQVLFEIDPTSSKILLDKAEAEVRRAQARRKFKESEWTRAKSMKPRGTISQEGFDRCESEFEEAEAALQAAQADRDLARLNLDATKVVSPMDGVLSMIVAQAGEPVLADSGVLARIVSLDPMDVDFYVSEDIARFLDRSHGGGKLKAGVSPELPILIGVRDEAGFPHRGKVDILDPQLQQVAESAVHLRATIPNPDGSLAPGLKARIRLVTNARHQALLIPDRFARFHSGSRECVYVVNGQDIVEKRPVRVGLRYDDLREVEEGLKPDEWVVMYPGEVNEGRKAVPERIKPPIASQ